MRQLAPGAAMITSGGAERAFRQRVRLNGNRLISMAEDGIPNRPPMASILEERLWKRLGQEWIRTTEGVKPADLRSVPFPS